MLKFIALTVALVLATGCATQRDRTALPSRADGHHVAAVRGVNAAGVGFSDPAATVRSIAISVCGAEGKQPKTVKEASTADVFALEYTCE